VSKSLHFIGGSFFVNVVLVLIFVIAMPAAGAYLFQSPPLSQAERDMQDRQVKEANKKRQQDIQKDTNQLFQLATELKAAVDKSNENTLSIDVVRKADEVEKLAKRVKEKMKEGVGPSPRTEPLPPPRAGRPR
jgi:septal ring factor EnvC (AmiA/AmiB activator)